MTILINLSSSYEVKIPLKKVKKFDWILSSYRYIKIKQNYDINNIITIPASNNLSIQMNNSFWILNLLRDNILENYKIDKIYIYHGNKLKLLQKNNKLISDEYDFFCDKNFIIINSVNIIRIPTSCFYKKMEIHKINLFIEVWIYFLLQKNYSTNIKLDEDIEKEIENDRDIKKLLNNIKKDLFINMGKEGKISHKDNKRKIIVKTIRKTKNKSKLYQDYGVEFAIKDIDKIYKNILNFEIVEKAEEIIYKYENKIFPTAKLDFVQMARIIIDQRAKHILIDDHKLINYGKIQKKPFFQTIYNDFGHSFITCDNECFKDGLIRDCFYLVKKQKYQNVREVIKSYREPELKTLLDEDSSFNLFFNFVKEGYSNNLKMVCHDPNISKNILDHKIVYTCNKNSTMNRLVKKHKGDTYVYDQKLNDVFKCDGKFSKGEFEEDGFFEELSINLEKVNGAIRWKRKSLD